MSEKQTFIIAEIMKGQNDMDTLKLDKGSIKMIAHRGLSGIERENTAAAFVAAGNRSYFGIETDVHRTADGKYIIIHDDTTDRVAGEHYPIEQTDFGTLRSLRLMDMNGEKNRGDLIMPTLEEYLSICKTYEKTAVLELKNNMAEAVILEIVDIVKGMGYLENTVFISFSLENLITLRKTYPTQPAQYLVGEIPDLGEMIDHLKRYHLDIDAFFGSITKEVAEELHCNGIKINVWTVDSLEVAEKMAEIGVDYITTNIIE